jgi:hypothetical protein
VTGGDFIPADRGISVNREMTQEYDTFFLGGKKS